MDSADKTSHTPAVIRSHPGLSLDRYPIILLRHLVVPSTDDDSRRAHQLIERTLHEITQLSPPKQAAVGGLSGMSVTIAVPIPAWPLHMTLFQCSRLLFCQSE